MSSSDPSLVPHRDLRTIDDQRFLFGGSPRRVLRLSLAGSRRVRSWFRGDGAPVSAADRRLADRLVDAGLAHPRRPSITPALHYDVVIPVLDDQEGVTTTLASLEGAAGSAAVIIVVDDGSRRPIVAPADSGGVLVRVVRHRINRGPGAARNTGAREGSSSLVLFIDAGVTIDRETIDTLLAWMEDPRSAAVAPRVQATGTPTAVGRYEVTGSPLDVARRETEPSVIGPTHAVRYVPSTMLLVARPAFDAAAGFDEHLRFGEDVDLVWRLAGRGRVMFDPAAVAWHPPRSTVLAFARQRFRYGASAGPLARRHGSALSPLGVTVPFASAVVAGLILPGPAASLWWIGATALDAARTGRLMHAATDGSPGSGALGVVETLIAWARSTEAAIAFGGRVGWPVSVVLVAQPFSRRLRQRALLATAAWTARAVRTRGLAQAPLAVLDDLAYGAGVWAGAVSARTWYPVVPTLVRKR